MDLENIAETSRELKKFEEDIAKLFLDEKIRSPVHFSGGNEKEIIKIFREIKPEDWVVTTYRNHYHALLKGMPKEELKERILSNESMYIMSKKYKIITTSIVGGGLPIAVGIAKGMKLQGVKRKVWAFCGDMTGETGIFHEAAKYSRGHNLPVIFVVEDNGLSVNTPTKKVWGESSSMSRIIRYSYKPLFPHQGVGKEVGF